MAIQKPNNDVIMGQPVPAEYLLNTEYPITPGDLLIFEEGSVQPATADTIQEIGWAGYGAAAVHKPTNINAIYLELSEVPVHAGGGFYVLARLAAGITSFAKGMPVESAGDGQIRAHTTGRIVGYTVESITSRPSNGRILIRSKI